MVMVIIFGVEGEFCFNEYKIVWIFFIYIIIYFNILVSGIYLFCFFDVRIKENYYMIFFIKDNLFGKKIFYSIIIEMNL